MCATQPESLEEFTRRLKESITWALPRVDVKQPKACLRSLELRPDLVSHYQTESQVKAPAQVSLLLNPKLGTEHGPEDWIWLTPSLIAALVESRRSALAKLSLQVDSASFTSVGGRLLVSFYEYTDHDGLSFSVTKGFLDNNDVPPWDLWVGDVPCTRTAPPTFKSIYTVMGGENIDRILVAWIPQPFVAVVQEAMDQEAFGMLAWLDDLPTQRRAFGVWSDLVPDWLRELK